MSVNFTIVFPPLSNSSPALLDLQCIDTTVGRHVLTAISCTYALFTVPLSVSVLCLGFQRRRRPRSGSSAATMTHSDFFTYNMAVTELIGAFGYIFPYISSYTNLPDMSSVGILIVSFIWPARTMQPICICVERYLAVVHPITYRSLRQAGGVTIRNISTGSIWLSCFAWLFFLILLNVPSYVRRAAGAFMLILSLIVMMFCSLSVLRTLIRPRPGSRVQVDQSKRRAVLTVLIIMAVLWWRFGGNVVVILIRFSSFVSVKCVGEAFTYVFFLPNCIMLPLLFFHRTGKLPVCKGSTGSG